jgi:hypothetical protein
MGHGFAQYRKKSRLCRDYAGGAVFLFYWDRLKINPLFFAFFCLSPFCYVPISQWASFFLIRSNLDGSISPIEPMRIAPSTTARRPTLITLAVFKPVKTKIFRVFAYDFVKVFYELVNLGRYHADKPIAMATGQPAEKQCGPEFPGNIICLWKLEKDYLPRSRRQNFPFRSSLEYSGSVSSSMPRIARASEITDEVICSWAPP